MPTDSTAGASTSHKKKRVSKESSEGPAEDGGAWECSLCTYRNRFEAFKCEMCDTRKGTSTRKPKLNDNVVERQKTVHNFVVQQQEKIVSVSGSRKRAHLSGSPTTSRHSPESSSSGSAARSANPRVGGGKMRRTTVPIPDMLIYRTSPKKITVTVNNVSATITEFRKKPVTAERAGPPRRNGKTGNFIPPQANK